MKLYAADQQQSILDTIRGALLAAAHRNGVPAIHAESIAQSVEEEIRRNHGGSKRYIPAQDKTQRNMDIMRNYNGRNRDHLCRCYGISISTLKRILACTNVEDG